MGERVDWWDDPGDDVDLHPERSLRRERGRESGREPGIVDDVGSVLLLGISVLVSPVTWFAVLISAMAFDACAERSDGCHYTIGSVAIFGHLVATGVVLVLGFCWTFARRRRHRSGWPVALATLVGVLLVFLTAVVTIDLASGGHLL